MGEEMPRLRISRVLWAAKEQEGWANENLAGDVNFGHCNSTNGFEDAGYDRDGHCHGSSDDSTYYWWIRDHWYRSYNGRLRCCCGWYESPAMTGAVPLYSRKIANRCDYRRLVTQTEDVSACRDANEEHGLGFDDIGCDPSLESAQKNQPVPDDDATCWEIHSFGYSESTAFEEEEEESGGLTEEETATISVVAIVVILFVVLLCIGGFCWWKRNKNVKSEVEAIQASAVPTGTGAEEAEPVVEVDVPMEQTVATTITQD